MSIEPYTVTSVSGHNDGTYALSPNGVYTEGITPALRRTSRQAQQFWEWVPASSTTWRAQVHRVRVREPGIRQPEHQLFRRLQVARPQCEPHVQRVQLALRHLPCVESTWFARPIPTTATYTSRRRTRHGELPRPQRRPPTGNRTCVATASMSTSRQLGRAAPHLDPTALRPTCIRDPR